MMKTNNSLLLSKVVYTSFNVLTVVEKLVDISDTDSDKESN